MKLLYALTNGDPIIWRRPARDGTTVLIRGKYWYRTPEKIAIKIRKHAGGELQTFTRFVDPEQIRPAQRALNLEESVYA